MLNIDKNNELQYIKDFIKESDDQYYYSFLHWQQLLSLWTTYCLHHNLTPDTYEYDTTVRRLYDQISSQLKEKNLEITNTRFKTYKEYDLYMGQQLA